MPSLVEAKEGLVTYLKGKSSITDELTDGADEIREWQWQGTEFTYANVRVRVRSVTPFANCALSDLDGSIYVFSQDASSKEADEIAGIIVDEVNRKSFTSSGVNYNLWVTEQIGSIRQDERTWRAEVILNGKVS